LPTAKLHTAKLHTAKLPIAKLPIAKLPKALGQGAATKARPGKPNRDSRAAPRAHSFKKSKNAERAGSPGRACALFK
jgi:hypothetical protein